MGSKICSCQNKMIIKNIRIVLKSIVTSQWKMDRLNNATLYRTKKSRTMLKIVFTNKHMINKIDVEKR